jgi:fructoselysine-6-P-deglycase FrlB-like protein
MPTGAGIDRVTAFRDDILAAPDELAVVLASHARAISALPPEMLACPRWRLLGMGSSGFAARDAAAALRAAGLDAAAEIASTTDSSPAGADTLAVVISSSGRTPQVLAAAERHRGSSFVLALTGRPGSPLASVTDAVILLVAERAEASGIASLTYRSTVAALSMLLDAAIGRPPGAGLAAAVPALASLVAGRRGWLSAAADVLDGGRTVHVLGDGARIGAAEQAALMLREAPRIPAVAFDTGDWLHVGLYTLLPGDPVLLLAGSPADDEAIATIRARGGRLVAVGPERRDADVHVPLPAAVLAEAAVRALVEPLVAELLAAELWRRATAEG